MPARIVSRLTRRLPGLTRRLPGLPRGLRPAPKVGRGAVVRLARLVALGARSVADSADDLASRWQGRGGARTRRLRQLNRIPLPNLYDLHPEVRSLSGRELGLRSISLDEIAGTAVAGAAQRGSDYRPLPDFRSRNWEARWQRIRSAYDRMEILPPIDVVRYADRYWVLDGHNRVAAALAVGQVEIDAVVTELRAPGAAATEAPVSLAAVLSEAADLRAAGAGRRSPTVEQPAGEEVGASAADDVADGLETTEEP